MLTEFLFRRELSQKVTFLQLGPYFKCMLYVTVEVVYVLSSRFIKIVFLFSWILMLSILSIFLWTLEWGKSQLLVCVLVVQP